MKSLTRVVAVVLVSLSVASGADWPHYRGPSLNGSTTETIPNTLVQEPKQLWKCSVGIGASSVTVVGDHVYTMGNVSGKDIVYCLDAASGREEWRHEFPLPVDAKNFEGGPRSTPTVAGASVFTLSHAGDVWCLDVRTGKPKWYKHLIQDFKGRRPDWGYSGSPTAEGRWLLLDSGGEGASTLALDQESGALVWQTGTDEAGYGSVSAGTLSGKRTAVVFKAKTVVGLDPDGGGEMWATPWKTSYDVNAATPVVMDDRVLVTSGYGSGSAMLQVAAGKVNVAWKNKNLRSIFNSPVVWQGNIYGIDGNEGSRGLLVCLDFATGELRWKETIGGGALICAAGRLVILNEKGEVIIADASPSGYRQIARWQALGGHCWAQPVLANGQLYFRNNAGDLVAYRME